MALIVEFNPDTRAEFLEPTFKQHPDFEEQLKAEFIYCKTNKVTTDIFGNDAIFTFPQYAVEAQLARIHIKLPSERHGLMVYLIVKRRVTRILSTFSICGTLRVFLFLLS